MTNSDPSKLPPLPARPRKYADVYVWTFVNFSETMPHPVSPMGWSLMERGVRNFFRPLRLANDSGYTAFEFLYGRVFWNLTPVFGSKAAFQILDRTLEMIGPSIREPLRRIFESGCVHPRPIYSLPQKLVLFLQVALLVPWILLHLVAALGRPAAVERGLDRLDADLRHRREIPGGDWRDAVRSLDRYLAWAFIRLKRAFGPAGLLLSFVTGLFMRVGGILLKSRGLLETLGLLTPPRPSKTMEGDLAFWELARRSDHLTASSPELLDYLERYGHRGPGEQDAYSPRPWDDPAGTLARARELGASAGPSPVERYDAVVRRQRAAVASRLRSVGFLRRLVAAPLQRAASRYLPYREDGKHYAMRILGHARRRLVAIGRGLRAEGLVDADDDVFFLEIEELSRLARKADPGLRSKIAERREQFTRWKDFRPPLLVTSEGIPEVAPAATGPILRGDPVSPGTARGRVRVVLDPLRDGRLEPGEILVAPHTDPGWTPLFLRAAAVITEVGGALSHGAVVAREFGLPAVVNVADATRLLKTGDMVEVDGALGEIRRG